MDEKLKYMIDILVDNNIVSKDEITNENYSDILSNIADGIDSILYMSILVDIEEKYGIELPENVLEKNVFENIDDFISIINDRINSHS